MNIEFLTYFWDGSTPNISADLKIDITTKFTGGDVVTNLVLNAGTPSGTAELLDNNGFGVVTTFTYNAATGKLTIVGAHKFPLDSINLTCTISSSTETGSIDLDIDFYDTTESEAIYIVDTPAHIKSSMMFIQEPLSNTIHNYNLTNCNISRCTVINDSITYTTSPDGIFVIENDAIFRVDYYYDYLVGTIPTTVSSSVSITFNYNTFLPISTTSFGNNGYLYNGYPTYNTTFIPKLNSNFTLINTFPQVNRIMQNNIVEFSLENLTGNSVYNQFMNKLVDNTTNKLEFLFTQFNNITDGDWIAKFNNYLPTKLAVSPSGETSLISGKYYYVCTKGSCTVITNALGNINITAVGQIIYIDPATYGVAGTLILFTTFDELTVIEVTEYADTIDDVLYYVLYGSMTINGVTFAANSLVMTHSTDTVVPGTAVFTPVVSDIFYTESYNVRTFNDIEILESSCGAYSIYNNSLNTITGTIYKLVYTVDNDGTFEEDTTLNMLSNTNTTFSPSEDGVYKFVFDNANNIETYYTVSVCNIEACVIKQIGNLICCNKDNTCECNLYTYDCKYIDRTNFIGMALLYDVLKDMILDVIGINAYYNDVMSDDILKLYSISDIINKLNNFTSCCDE